MNAVPEPECWLNDHVDVQPSDIAGWGLFARSDIGAGVIVSRLGGRIVSDQTLNEMIEVAPGSTYIDSVSVLPDANLVLSPGSTSHFGNHSCDPNLWWDDPLSFATRRPVPRGMELTVDYGTFTDDPDFRMDCRCRASACRGVITGTDWRRTDLQARYGEHWAPVLRYRINAAQTRPV